MDLCFSISDVDWSLTKDAFGILGSSVSLVGVVVATYFGYQGLSAWKMQLRGNTDHKLAMDTLVELYGFRDAVASARRFVFLPNAFDFGPSSVSLENQILRYRKFEEELNAKHAIVLSAKARFEASALGCEAAWGKKLEDSLKNLKDLYDTLDRSVRVTLLNCNPNLSDQTKSFYNGIYKIDGAIAFKSDDKESSKFTEAFAAAIKSMELSLRAKL